MKLKDASYVSIGSVLSVISIGISTTDSYEAVVAVAFVIFRVKAKCMCPVGYKDVIGVSKYALFPTT